MVDELKPRLVGRHWLIPGRMNAGSCKAACLILKRQVRILPGLLSACILYAPKGPLLDWHDQPLVERVLSDLKQIAREEKSIFIKIDPDIVYATGLPGAEDEKSIPEGTRLQGDLKRLGLAIFRRSDPIPEHDRHRSVLYR